MIAAQRAGDTSIDHDNPLEEVYEDQLLCADLIVLNKADLMDAATIARVTAEIRAAAPRAVKLVETREGHIEPGILLGLSAAAEDDLLARPSHHDTEEGHDHDDFDSFIVDLPESPEPQALVDRLARVAADFDVLRIKGFVSVAAKPMRLLVQGVGNRFRHQFDRAWKPGEARLSRLVVIGQKGIDRAAITAALRG
jgi:cobalamin biosynthesis protein CobW